MLNIILGIEFSTFTDQVLLWRITVRVTFMICGNKSHSVRVWSPQHDYHACLGIEYTSRVEQCSVLKEIAYCNGSRQIWQRGTVLK